MTTPCGSFWDMFCQWRNPHLENPSSTVPPPKKSRIPPFSEFVKWERLPATPDSVAKRGALNASNPLIEENVKHKGTPHDPRPENAALNEELPHILTWLLEARKNLPTNSAEGNPVVGSPVHSAPYTSKTATLDRSNTATPENEPLSKEVLVPLKEDSQSVLNSEPKLRL
jgi:hypothetical protein